MVSAALFCILASLSVSVSAGTYGSVSSQAKSYAAVVDKDSATFTFPVPHQSEYEWGPGGLQYTWNVTVRNNPRNYEFGFYLFTPMGAGPVERGDLEHLLESGQCSVWSANKVLQQIPITCEINGGGNAVVVKVSGSKALQTFFSTKPHYVTMTSKVLDSKRSERVLLSYLPKHDVATNAIKNRTPQEHSAPSPTSIPQASTLVIQTPSGPVQVRNFYRGDPKTLGPNVVLRETKKYHIEYVTSNSQFLIALLGLSNQEDRVARTQAEDDLLRILGITKAQACRLDVSVAVPIGDNPKLAGPNYGLSFCHNGIRF